MKIVSLTGVPRAGKDTCADFLMQTYPNVVKYKFATPLQDIAALFADVYDDEEYRHRQLFDNALWKDDKFIHSSSLLGDEIVRMQLIRHCITVLCNEPYNTKKMLEEMTLTIDNKLYTGLDLYNFLSSEIDEIFVESKYSPRDVQKLFGTELMRDRFNTNTWTALMENKLATTAPSKVVLITDMRFQNELLLLQKWKNFKLVYVERMDAVLEAKRSGLLEHASESCRELFLANANCILYNNGTVRELYESLNNWYTTHIVMGDEQ